MKHESPSGVCRKGFLRNMGGPSSGRPKCHQSMTAFVMMTGSTGTSWWG